MLKLLRKNKKQLLFYGSLLVLLAGAVWFWFYWDKLDLWFLRKTQSEVYRIMNSEGLAISFVEAVIDPLKVEIGDTQKMQVTVRDNAGIQYVLAEIETDTKTRTVPLKFERKTEAGDFDEYVYSGRWRVEDTHAKVYHTTFKARDIENREVSITLAWSDPCVIPDSGTWTTDSNCTITGIDGVDAGDYIHENYTLTINNGATFVYNPGRSFSINSGSIAIATGGQIKKTYLWYQNTDGDGYPSSVQVASDTQPSNTIRKSLATASKDCYDANVNVYPGSTYCSTANRGDGSYDYNCSGTQTYCGTQYYTPISRLRYNCNASAVTCNATETYYSCAQGAITCGAGGYMNNGSLTTWYGCCNSCAGTCQNCNLIGTYGVQSCQ